MEEYNRETATAGGFAGNELPPLTPEAVQRQIWETRHKKELPLYASLSVLGMIACAVMIYLRAQEGGIIEELKKFFHSAGIEQTLPDFSRLMGYILLVLGLLGGFTAIILLMLTVIVMLYRYYGEEMAYGVRVSENNFPEIHKKVQEFSWLLGLKKAPEVYIRQENGTLNAFTSWIPGKTFIQLNAEITDIAYLEHKDFDTLFFVIGHEMGHIYLHHVQIYYQIWPLLSSFIPVIGPYFLHPLLSRSREYSADRVGQALTRGKNQEECMMLLGVGRHLYKHMNVRNYIADILKQHNTPERLGRWVINLLASHPIMPFRTAAILDPEKKSGRLL